MLHDSKVNINLLISENIYNISKIYINLLIIITNLKNYYIK